MKPLREAGIIAAMILLILLLPLIFAISPVMGLVNRIWPPNSGWKQYTDHRPYGLIPRFRSWLARRR